MNIYITLDYELFFGTQSGSVEKCIIEPTKVFLELLEPFGIKANFFVDAGYLIALEKQKEEFQKLQSDFEKITDQIKELVSNGHGIELHIHPHWEDSYYDGTRWVFNTTRYKLSDFKKEDVSGIITKYTNVLKNIAGKNPVAYRAGGWSAQPFGTIGDALKKNGVLIDSTVYPQGFYASDNQNFDFRNVRPFQTEYKFSQDLTLPDKSGEFLEVPISSIRVNPFFYWYFVFIKLLKGKNHRSFGDGASIPTNKKEAVRLLTNFSHSVVSIDGFKASLLNKAFKNYIKHNSNEGSFVMIGHPKAFTPYSLRKLKEFIVSTACQNRYSVFYE